LTLPLEKETDPSFRLAVSASKLGSSVNEIWYPPEGLPQTGLFHVKRTELLFVGPGSAAISRGSQRIHGGGFLVTVIFIETVTKTLYEKRQ
jgi:hypothetical protein